MQFGEHTGLINGFAKPANGTLLCGISAGSICWYESGITDSYGPTMAAVQDALGFIPGSNSPHYDGEAQRRPTYQRLIREGILPAGYAVDNGCALHFENGQLKRAVSSRPEAKAYQVESINGNIVETPITAEYLFANL